MASRPYVTGCEVNNLVISSVHSIFPINTLLSKRKEMARPELTVELSKLNLISRIKETIFQSGTLVYRRSNVIGRLQDGVILLLRPESFCFPFH